MSGPGPADAPQSSKNDARRAALEKLLRDRQRKFTSLLVRVLSAEDAGAVHDLREWSRRLQQLIAAGCAKPIAPQARGAVRALRRARRAMGVWRDCDVAIDLLNRKLRRLRNAEERQAYAMIRDLAASKRERGIRRARRKLASRKLLTLAERTEQLLAADSQPASAHPSETLSRSIGEAYEQWRASLARACEGFAPGDIHFLRTRTKRLRYRIEMARDLGDREAETALDLLKSLQEILGAWHDHQQLLRLTAEALADPEFMLTKTKLVATLLRKSHTQQTIRGKHVQSLLAATQQNLEQSVLHRWIAGLRTTVSAPATASGQTGEHATPHQADSPAESDNPESSASCASLPADAPADAAAVHHFVGAMSEPVR